MDMTIDPEPEPSPAPDHATTTTTTAAAAALPPPDAAIDQSAALAYWNSIPSTVNGMLGGFSHISRIDLQGSANFLSKLRRSVRMSSSSPTTTSTPTAGAGAAGLLPRAADCGAGIGRITHGFLRSVVRRVDVVEPVRKFTEELQAAAAAGAGAGKAGGEVGEVLNLGLQDWTPEPGAYNLIWNQWCLGHLTDVQLMAYLRRCRDGLVVPEGDEGGKAFAGAWIVVKENMSTDADGRDIFDEDSSVTRTDAKFRTLFKEAGLRIVATEVQKGFPRDLYPVRMYALRPK